MHTRTYVYSVCMSGQFQLLSCATCQSTHCNIHVSSDLLNKTNRCISLVPCSLNKTCSVARSASSTGATQISARVSNSALLSPIRQSSQCQSAIEFHEWFGSPRSNLWRHRQILHVPFAFSSTSSTTALACVSHTSCAMLAGVNAASRSCDALFSSSFERSSRSFLLRVGLPYTAYKSEQSSAYQTLCIELLHTLLERVRSFRWESKHR
jgi:hypothetical protein